MDVVFYYNTSDNRVLNKRLYEGIRISGQARDEIDIMEPVVLFDSTDIPYNYAFIPQFSRYYSVVGKNVLRENLIEVSFEVDVLMSFRYDISNLKVIVDKQSDISNGNEYIDDGSLVAENVMFQSVYNYPNGFNDAGEFILITAG